MKVWRLLVGASITIAGFNMAAPQVEDSVLAEAFD